MKYLISKSMIQQFDSITPISGWIPNATEFLALLVRRKLRYLSSDQAWKIHSGSY